MTEAILITINALAERVGLSMIRMLLRDSAVTTPTLNAPSAEKSTSCNDSFYGNIMAPKNQIASAV